MWMAAIGTLDLTTPPCWQLPEVTQMSGGCKDMLLDSLNRHCLSGKGEKLC
jgi:hypothetical protein